MQSFKKIQEKRRDKSGYVMQLQNFSVNDGEGIRTNIFLAGCPLRCRWCSNPEGQTMDNVMVQLTKAETVLKQVEKQMIFYRNSGGGVTFSGGEATFQQGFLRELADQLYNRGVSLAIETCGYFVFDEVEDIFQKMDLIFLDIKHMDEEKHKKLTGVSNQVILHNIPRLGKLGIPLVVRIPVIKGVNADQENLHASFSYMRENVPGAALELLPYHTLGEAKYRELNRQLPPETFARPSDEELERIKKMAQAMGIKIVSYR